MGFFYYVIIGLAVPALVAGFLSLVVIFIKNKKNNIEFSDRFKYSAMSYLCILVAFVNCLVNMGDIRSMLIVPIFIHSLMFFGITCFASGYIANSESLEKSVAMGVVMYLFTHLLMPDFSKDVADTYYLFFKTIYSDRTATVCLTIAVLAFIVNIIMLIRQLYLAIKIR